ncbi:bacillithiol system redox-active protein YtxJ [Flavobacteriaceae bacterium XHP0103]|uniref:bacillithiol system redox-active protein YtxJ n=1 Tax=Marixanthotalea marina TaxID=2844359 RepID=UPI002989A545|nr:bacillithiol system redox-active protein YtxJ [Marixanthotalea marina]MBU3821621.1 bacillithiol system redox-active protein YtxJ [Marixanthotalea marina]
MGLFNKLFSNNTEEKEENKLPWIDLTDVNQLESIKEKSKTKTQFIFKHSTRCGISRMVMNQFVGNFDLDDNVLDLYHLDLIQNRAVSNAVADSFNVVHESPQLLVIKNGQVVAHESHGSINDLDLKAFV